MKKVKAFRGTRMKSARIEAGFRSARAFARKYRLNEITYSQHEQGRRNASVDDIERYAKALKVEPSWISFEHITDRKPRKPRKIDGLPMHRHEIRPGKLLTRRELKQFSFHPCYVDPHPSISPDQQSVYRAADVGNTLMPPGPGLLIVGPYSRAEAKEGRSLVVAVRRGKKYEVRVGRIVRSRPEYFTLDIGHGKHVTATTSFADKYLATILYRVLRLIRDF